VLAALCCVSPARADSGTPPPTTPTSTTPEAPPPDPYRPPAPSPKPKQARPVVVHAAPVYRTPVRTYTPPAPAVRVRTVQPQRTASPRAAKVVHTRKARVVHRHVAQKAKPKPVRVTFNPFGNLVAASNLLATAEGTSDRGRYLWLAGFAFALLAMAGLSLHLLAVRTVE